MSPQRSNRNQLIEGTLRCLQRLPPERITTRVIAAEAGANVASITYHFGSKDALVTIAVVEGLDRWLAEIGAELAGLDDEPSAVRYDRAAQVVGASRERHAGLARTFLGALAMALHDDEVRGVLAEGFRRTRPAVAALLGLGADQVGEDAAGLVVAQFNGLLFQSLLEPALAIEGDRMQRAQARLRASLPVTRTGQ